MMSLENREKVMVASYLGGASIANTYVGVVHPLSAGLSTVLHFHHCISNCIVMNTMEKFYPKETEEFRGFMRRQNVKLPEGVCSDLDEAQFQALYDSAIIHEKPLINALGDGFKDILNFNTVSNLYRRM
jgi:3-deoxy-alpha-D-manno-octulosonate 8-oxidase